MTKWKESSTGGSVTIGRVEYKPLPGGPPNNEKVTILDNIYWRELGLLVFVWVSFLALQIGKV